MPSSAVRKWVLGEVFTRAVVIIVFMITEELAPFHRIIQPEEAYLYRNPNTTSIVSSPLLWVAIVSSTVLLILLLHLVRKDGRVSFLLLAVPTLALPLNGVITNLVKITVGRPRPDYLHRCYGEAYKSVLNLSQDCTGPDYLVQDGRKSFPSGHSSMSFCGFGFIFLLLAAEFRIFSSGRGRPGHLLLAFLPLFMALMVAISRTCDYHHHWQDVLVGSILGFSIVYLIYRQYFPPLTSHSAHIPLLVMEDEAELLPGSKVSKKNLVELNGIKTV